MPYVPARQTAVAVTVALFIFGCGQSSADRVQACVDAKLGKPGEGDALNSTRIREEMDAKNTCAYDERNK